MAKKVVTLFTCDKCGKELEDGKASQLIATPQDLRKQPKKADLCDDCFKSLPGVTTSRRGRKPAAAAAR